MLLKKCCERSHCVARAGPVIPSAAAHPVRGYSMHHASGLFFHLTGQGQDCFWSESEDAQGQGLNTARVKLFPQIKVNLTLRSS